MKAIAPALMIGLVSLLTPVLSISQALSGNLANYGNNDPNVAPLLLLHAAMSKTYDKADAYYKVHNTCAPENTFLTPLGKGNLISYITNKKDCSIEAKFGNNAPSQLQNGLVRVVPKCSDSTHCDFGAQLSVTDIGFGRNQPSLLKMPRPAFASSIPFQAAGLTVAAVSTGIASKASYNDISQGTAAATGNSSSGATGSYTSNISTV